MSIADEMTFDEWFDLFVDRCKALGYTGPIDKYCFEWNYEDGETPEYAAEEFVNEMNN
jgi:ketol-acid reductoisomerase